MVSNEEIELILSGSYKWIKVPRLKFSDDLTDEQKYAALDAHHIDETSFLINKVRELAQQIKDLQNGL